MPVSVTAATEPMKLTDFYQIRMPFEKLARERVSDRLNHQDDTPYGTAVIEEMLMALMQHVQVLEARLAEMEATFKP